MKIEESLKKLQDLYREKEDARNKYENFSNKIFNEIKDSSPYWQEWLAWQLNKGRKDGDYEKILGLINKKSYGGEIMPTLVFKFSIYVGANKDKIRIYYDDDDNRFRSLLIPLSDFDKIDEVMKADLSKEAIESALDKIEEGIKECKQNLANAKYWENRLGELEKEKSEYINLKYINNV